MRRGRSSASGAGPQLRRAGRRLPGNLGLAREAWARAASPGHARDRGTQAGAAAGGTGGWARGLRPLTMVEGRFSKFLKKLAFSGAGHQYQLLERGELETLVSPGAGRETRPPPTPSHPEPVRALGAALLRLARLPLVLERTNMVACSMLLYFFFFPSFDFCIKLGIFQTLLM